MNDNPYQSPTDSETPSFGRDAVFAKCHRCGEDTEEGLNLIKSGLYFSSFKQAKQFVSKPEDLSKVGWRAYFPSRVRYFRAYICRKCQTYTIDFSRKLSHTEAQMIVDKANSDARSSMTE